MPALANPPRITDYITDCLNLALGYGQMLVKDIPPDTFAHMPHPKMNHPAFCIGHLSIYPDRMFQFIGRGDLARERANYLPLFQAGAECVEQEGRYPPKDELVSYYVERYKALAEILRDVDEEVLQRPNPREGRFREMCPTVGSAVNFLAGAHHMSHLGQISAWRRAVGLPPAM
jgi:hypothetical protein